jgi:hypothetical protein
VTLQIKVHSASARCEPFYCCDQQHLADFVRMEYALALKLKKNIVPVAHEEFEFPDSSRLPKDCAGVMAMNAVKCVPLQLLLLNITFCALWKSSIECFQRFHSLFLTI